MAKINQVNHSVSMHKILWEKVRELETKFNISRSEALQIIVRSVNVSKLKY